jgi:hypothetical protein
MKILKLTDFLILLDSYLDGNSAFKILRDFIYGYFEAEENLEVDSNLSDILSVLAPYFEYEEAFGDPKREIRLKHLRQSLVSTTDLKERVIFAIEFDKIMSLTDKLNRGTITQKVYDEQLKKLSPARFDSHRISVWANRHNGESDIDIRKIV